MLISKEKEWVKQTFYLLRRSCGLFYSDPFLFLSEREKDFFRTTIYTDPNGMRLFSGKTYDYREICLLEDFLVFSKSLPARSDCYDNV